MTALARLSGSSPLANPGLVTEALVNFIPDLTASRRKATIEALRRNSLNPDRVDGGGDQMDSGPCPTSAENGDANGFGPAGGRGNAHLAGMPLLLSGGTSLAALESLTNGAQGLGGIALGLVDGRAGGGSGGVGADRRRSSPKQQEPVLDLSSKPLSKLNTANPTDAAALAVTNLLQTIHNQVKPPTQVRPIDRFCSWRWTGRGTPTFRRTQRFVGGRGGCTRQRKFPDDISVRRQWQFRRVEHSRLVR